MFIDTIPNRKSPPAVLLRESYREGGRAKKRTLANLSKLPQALIEGIVALLDGGRALGTCSSASARRAEMTRTPSNNSGFARRTPV